MSSAAESGQAGDQAIVIGVGSAHRRDDGVGPYVAEALSRRGVPAVAHEGDGAGLLDLWESREVCVVVDAVAGPHEPGAISLFADIDDPALARAGFVHSTHRLGLPEAVALGRALGRLPARLIVIGVAGAEFGRGQVLSPPVAAAADRLIDRLAMTDGVLSGGALLNLP